MTTYRITAFGSVTYYTIFTVEADRMDEAIRKAREQAEDESGTPCDGVHCEWDEFQICSSDNDSKSVTYIEPSRVAANAAEDLLDAAKFALPLLEDYAGSSDNKLERKAFHKLRVAIAKATKQ